MGKNRKSKRQLIRDEKRAKKRGRDLADEEERDAKRQRQNDDNDTNAGNAFASFDPTADYIPFNDDDGANYDPNGATNSNNNNNNRGRGQNFEREFFGMLADEEQEYFRHADEMLELNDFPSPEDREIFLQSVYREARGKELKLASSQSCSRLMERLILLSDARQKKRLFGAFAGHFMSLVTHRFAGHCCEKLFLLSAPVVTEEMTGGAGTDGVGDVVAGEDGEQDGAEEVTEAMKTSMEDLFLLTLDELEAHLSFLLSDRYGSHALRVLLVALSGRPLNQAGTKSLLQGRSKEHITVEGASARASELSSQTRAVPSSFTTAIQKIIADSTADMDATALRVLAKHPTGNPTLQLLLDLELSLSAKSKGAKAKNNDKESGTQGREMTLLEKLVPDAPASFSDEKSPACEFVNGMLYDPIGSRLLETLITYCPGKIFKGLQANIFGPRIQSLLRNDIASYPAIKVLSRLSKEDLADAVQKSLPEITSFVEKGRLNVIRTFFERCSVRNASAELGSLLQALTTACGGNWKHLIPKLCLLEEPEPEETKGQKFQQPDAKNKTALISHGSQVASTLLDIPGPTSKAIQTSLLVLSPEQLLHMATSSNPTAAILTKALAVPPQVPHFHKLLVSALLPNVYDLATSQHGNGIVNAIISAPSKGEGVAAVPFHQKENIMAQLERHEKDLRSTWLGRNVWRTWRGDLWAHRRHDWVRWAKETDPEGERVAAMPVPKQKEEEGKNKKGLKGKGKYEGVGMQKDKKLGEEKGFDKRGEEKRRNGNRNGNVAVAA
ncbi:Nucleolar protein 9 [Madurella fahalii]|uniref:Nucleolar protein 9 n=1 Tax=Madurella fahalii TaxID=1157608 RepID=A0ABQ0GIJ8_9PEZI